MNYHDTTAELELIGAMLTSKKTYLDTFDVVTSEDFYTESLGKCYRILSDAFRDEIDVNLATIAKESGHNLPELISSMENGDLSALFAKAKATKIRSLANKRRVYTGCRMLVEQIGSMEPVEISTRLSEIAAMVSMSGDIKRVFDGTEMFRRVCEVQEERQKDPGVIRGVLTQYACFDHTLRGLRPKRMTVIAAGTGFGKTTLALNLFERVVIQDKRTLFISNENDIDDNLDRLCAMGAEINLQDVESGRNYRPVCLSFKEKYKDKHVYLSDNAPRTVDEIIVTMQRHVMQHQVEIVFFDYIGEISGDALRGESEEGKLARYTQRLLDATKQLGVHLIMLTQLNREGNKTGRPSKTELGGCFKIAQKAHCLILFWQDEEKNDIITIEKNRQGPAHVDIKFHYDRAKQLLREDGFWDAEKKEIFSVDMRVPMKDDMPDF
jgi:replicative DNA helicase